MAKQRNKTDCCMNAYQKQALKFAQYPFRGRNSYYTILGLCGESGELADKAKKVMRDCDGVISPEMRSEMLKELGDVLWYVAATAAELGAKLADVANDNIGKLADRAKRGVIRGSGDNR